MPQFLTPVFLQYWSRSRADRSGAVPTGSATDRFLRQRTSSPEPLQHHPDTAAVEHARTYLSNFGAVPRIYQDMRTAAAKAGPAIDFNRQYPNSAPAVVEPHVVPGEFTRSGFAFMQDAIQSPGPIFSGRDLGAGRAVRPFARYREREQAIGGNVFRRLHQGVARFPDRGACGRLWIPSRSF